MKLSKEQQFVLQVLADAVRITRLFQNEDADLAAVMDAARSVQTVCPKKFLQAVNLGRLLVETGTLASDGRDAQTVFDAMAMIAERQEFFDAIFEMSKNCPGCSND